MSLEVLVLFYSCSYYRNRGGPSLKKKKKNTALLIRGKIVETLNELGQF